MDELPNIDDIIQGKKIDIPTKNSTLYALCIGITYALKEDFSIEHLSNVLDFSLKLDGEFTILLIRDLQKNGIDVESSPKWKDWVDEHRFLVN